MTYDWSIEKFSLTDFIEHIQQGMIHVWLDNKKYPAVRIHWFDYNQPIRITFPDYSPPNIIVVLQVYGNDIDKDIVKYKKLWIEF